MYTVQWCGHEGNLNEQQFQTLDDAILEKVFLDEKYDDVRILDANKNLVHL